MVHRIRTALRASLSASGPWTPVYGAARSILALSTLLTLMFNEPDLLFQPMGIKITDLSTAAAAVHLSLFSVFNSLEMARWIAVAILLVVMTGWRPRLTGLLHWWVSFSFAASAVVVEGGDQVVAVLTLLLIPVTLLDARKWHWQIAGPQDDQSVRVFAARSALVMIRIQVAVIYVTAAIGKFAVTEWVNGTAIYYWLVHPMFGLSGLRARLLHPVITHPVGIVAMTWGTLLLELLLASALVGPLKMRRALFYAGLTLHLGIMVLHGLVAFGMAMIAALILYLRAPVGRSDARAGERSDAPETLQLAA